MKIAVITDDGNTVSQHFGRAAYYKNFTIEKNQVIESQLVNKLGHNQFSGEAHEEHHGEAHGMDEEHHNRHAQMADPITGCTALICGGMGMGAYESMRRLNIQPIVTDKQDIAEAVKAFIEGKLVDHVEKLH